MSRPQSAYVEDSKNVTYLRVGFGRIGQLIKVVLQGGQVLVESGMPEGAARCVFQAEVLQVTGAEISEMPGQVTKRLLQLQARTAKFGRL